MTLRNVPGAFALGLLASLAAHTVLHTGRHSVGGAFHDLLLQIALAAALGLVAWASALAWIESGGVTDFQHPLLAA